MAARLIAVKPQTEHPFSAGVGQKLPSISGQRRRRASAAKGSALLLHDRGTEGRFHPLQVAHQPTHLLCHNRNLKGVVRFQQHDLTGCQRLLQSLSDSAVGRFPKVSALSVLDMRASGQQGNLHIGQLRAGQHALVPFFKNMGSDQILPVLAQHIQRTLAVEGDTAAALRRRQPQMNLRIVAQRLVMSVAHHRFRNGFAVQNAAIGKFHLQAKALTAQLTQYLQLDLAHHPNLDFLQGLFKADSQHRVLVLQLAQCLQGGTNRHLLGQHNLCSQNRGQMCLPMRAVRPNFIAGTHPVQAGRRTQLSCRHLLDGGKFGSVIDSQLVDFLGGSAAICQHDRNLVPCLEHPGLNL